MRPHLSGLLIASSLSAFGLGCSNAEDAIPAATGGGEPTALHASAGTQRELGVVVWGVDGDANDAAHTVARGYDASNARVVEVRSDVVFHDEAHATFAIGASVDGQAAVARLDAARTAEGIEGRYVTNTLQQNRRAMRVLRILAADIASEAASGVAAANIASRVAPKDLVSGINDCLVYPHGAILTALLRAARVFGETCEDDGSSTRDCVDDPRHRDDPMYDPDYCKATTTSYTCEIADDTASKAWNAATSTCD